MAKDLDIEGGTRTRNGYHQINPEHRKGEIKYICRGQELKSGDNGYLPRVQFRLRVEQAGSVDWKGKGHAPLVRQLQLVNMAPAGHLERLCIQPRARSVVEPTVEEVPELGLAGMWRRGSLAGLAD